MNNNKCIRPNLLDPIMKKKIIKTLNPPVEDYWAPTKSGAKSFIENYIKPNIGFFIFVILVILFLFYRYRVIKKGRERSELENQLNGEIIEPVPIQSNNIISTNDYSQLLMYLYEKQKDSLREPIHKNFSSRMLPAKPHTQEAKLAYPIYPHAKATLTPKRK